MEAVDFNRLEQLEGALQPTRWLMLRRAANRPLFRADEALEIARENPKFKGADRAARYHATWLKEAGLLNETQDEGRLAYRLSDDGQSLYGAVLSRLEERSEAVQPRAEPRLVAVLATATAGDFEALLAEEGEAFDLAASLRTRLETVVSKRARISVQPQGPLKTE